MGLTITERPLGHILSTVPKTGLISSVYGTTDAMVGSASHGLADSTWIYIVSDIENYSGFFVIDLISADTFKLRAHEPGTYVPYIQDATVTWYESELDHGWSAVHLPITYRIASDLYPLNTVDTSRFVSSVSEAHGYTVINASGDLGSGVNSYDFVEIDVVLHPELRGIYQIIEFISPTVIIVNLAYDSSINFTGATVQKRYNNYNVLVQVYAGISASHQWTNEKPYELAATLELIPDENNECFFSVNEILKSYIETRNNLQLGTLPNNIDFWTNFYIKTAERYDDSDGYTFGTTTTPAAFTSDLSNFEGFAVNAKLEFKNFHSGSMSDYLMNDSNGKFLTLFTIPVLFSCGDDTPDCYQDISFLNPNDGTVITVVKEFYLNGALQTTESEELDIMDSGVIRIPVEANCSYDRVDIHLISAETILNLASFVNIAGSDTDWTTGSSPFVALTAGNDSDILRGAFVPTTGQATYVITYDITRSAGAGTASCGFILYDSGGSSLGGSVSIPLSVGNNSGQVLIVASSDQIAYIGVHAASVGGDNTITVNDLSYDGEDTLSESKRFRIDCGCSNQEIRLTWLNNLGGFDYWAFIAKKDHLAEIREAIETKKNILPQWPKSYSSTADTIRKQTARVSNKAYTVRSQFLTEDEVTAISYIKSSVLVQIINSRLDRRTVIVDTDSFVKFRDGDKTFEIAFNISFTDDIPSQTV